MRTWYSENSSYLVQPGFRINQYGDRRLDVSAAELWSKADTTFFGGLKNLFKLAFYNWHCNPFYCYMCTGLMILGFKVMQFLSLFYIF